MQDLFSYDIDVTDLGGSESRIAGTIVNRSGAAWERGENTGELKLGFRLLSVPDDTVLIEARADPLPARLEPGIPVPFGGSMDLATLRPGRYRLEIGLLRERLFWFFVHGAPVWRSEILVPARPEPPPEPQILHPAPAHPYARLPGGRFWTKGVSRQPAGKLGPLPAQPFAIAPDDRVATAGSCFAQHIARRLQASFRFVQTEVPPPDQDSYFSANYGNIYTARQLRQLLLRAYGLMRPRDIAWRRNDGRFLDPFRPQIFRDGFGSEHDVKVARDEHLRRVRQVFQDSDVFVFTLGLTEAWLNEDDGAVLPVPPGVVAREAGRGPYRFMNFAPDAVIADLQAFITDVRLVNPGLKIVLTVSPVPLVATYEDRHVLVANGYSKAALRVAAEAAAARNESVAYFPSYELITSPAARGAHFEEDARSVTALGVSNVMEAFAAAFLRTGGPAAPPQPTAPPIAPSPAPAAWREERATFQAVICDEELLERPLPPA